MHPNADVERMAAVAARHTANLEAAAEEYLATTIFKAEPPSEAERARIARLEAQAKGQLDMFEEQGQEDEPATVRRVTKYRS